MSSSCISWIRNLLIRCAAVMAGLTRRVPWDYRE